MTNVVTEINIIPIKPKNGHIAFASFVLFDQIYINSVAVYTRFGGGIRLVYPRKKNIDICHPINHEFGQIIEKHILSEINENDLFGFIL
jgi:hypothetical protein